MKIKSVSIHNFRGIIDGTFDLFDYSLFVGPNNSGKTMVVDSIRAFYEKDGFKFKPDHDFPFIVTNDKESWIEIIFRLSDEEFESLAAEYHLQKNILKVRKYFQTEQKSH